MVIIVFLWITITDCILYSVKVMPAEEKLLVYLNWKGCSSEHSSMPTLTFVSGTFLTGDTSENGMFKVWPPCSKKCLLWLFKTTIREAQSQASMTQNASLETTLMFLKISFRERIISTRIIEKRGKN